MLNRIIIHGRLTRDPELRYTQSQTPVASFTVAVDRDYTDQSGDRGVDFIDCIAWRSGAEFVSKYFHKGQLILVEGRLTSRKWEDRDGNKRTAWEIVADHTYFGEPKREESRGYDSYQAPSQPADPQPTSGRYMNQAPSATTGYPQTQQYQQQTFTDLGDDDGDLPF